MAEGGEEKSVSISDYVWSYWNKGFSIIPIKAKDKRPNIKSWEQYQSTPATKEAVQKWLDDGIFQNIGVICGAVSNNLVVIDIDDEKIIDEIGIKLNKVTTKGAWVVKTGKGYHIYCKHNGDPGGITKYDDLHIEFRANGGYVVAPPSVHPNGHKYHFFNHATADNLPSLVETDAKLIFNDMVKKLKEKRGITTVENKKISDLKKGVKNGARNVSAFKLACEYRDGGLTSEETTKLMLDWNKKCKPPIHEQEIITCIKSAYSYSSKPQRGSESFQIPIENGGHEIATLQILNKNKFRINGENNSIILPPIQAKTAWFSSTYYQGKIINALVKNCKLREEEAEKTTNKLCIKAGEKINWLEQNGAFSKELNEDKQSVLDKIERVSVTRSEDGNVYNLHLDGEIIKLKDSELYDGPHIFCIQFLNRFLKKIIISKEEWDDGFIPHILSEDRLEVEEEKIESELDNVYRKFRQYIKNKKVFNWTDTDKRAGYKDSLYFRMDTNIVLICSDLIQDFFERFKISTTHKITVTEFNSFLREEKNLLIKGRQAQRVGKDALKSFWSFDAEKLGVTSVDIVEEESVVQGSKDGKLDVFKEQETQ